MTFYYFKFGEGNFPIIDKSPPEVRELGIFWGDWTIGDYKRDPSNVPASGRQQADLFCDSLKQGDYLVVWFRDLVNFYRVVNQDIFDRYHVPYSPNQKSSSDPCKIRQVQHVNSYAKDKLPDFFFRLNSNQAYNRRTIVVLKDVAHEVATFLCSGKEKKIEITLENYLQYLSPIEFESFIAFSLWESGEYPGTYRGGTIKDVDLIVFDKDKVANPKDYYQIKYKDLGEKKFFERNGKVVRYLHLGTKDFHWIKKPEGRLLKWLLNLFHPDIFDVKLL